MTFEEVVENSERVLELKRFASAYVIDFRNLDPDEIKRALIKTAPQYFHPSNVAKAYREIVESDNREQRTLAPIFLGRILLHKDGFISPVRDTEDAIIDWEQSIVDASNQNELVARGQKEKILNLFKFVLETAWQSNDSISPDEKNLIEKLRSRLGVSEPEYRIIEADIGKFPKPENELHTRTEIEEVRRSLQSAGLVASIKDTDGEDYDVIAVETAVELRKLLELELRNYAYKELLNTKFVRKRAYLLDILGKCGFDTDGLNSSDEIKAEALERIRPSVVLGGLSPRDGLPVDELSRWCEELGVPVSGSKNELISRIIDCYDNLRERDESVSDEREIWYHEYPAFASRDIGYLRTQQLIEKDIEIERKFEEATNFLFDKKLGHKPLQMIGSAHPDGAISHGNGLLYWDNKSKESEVNLKDHIRQFDTYIREADKPVRCFLVIAPRFTDESQALAMDYKVKNGTIITLITADELRKLANRWAEQQAERSESSFPLGYFEQSGRFNPNLVPL